MTRSLQKARHDLIIGLYDAWLDHWQGIVTLGCAFGMGCIVGLGVFS